MREVGLELFTAPKRQNVGDVSVNGPRERSSDCSIEEREGVGWHCYFYNSPQPPYIPSPRRRSVVFIGRV